MVANGIHWIIKKKKQGNFRKPFISVSLTMLKPSTVDHDKLWKALREMGIPDHHTCLLRNLYGTTDLFKIK